MISALPDDHHGLSVGVAGREMPDDAIETKNHDAVVDATIRARIKIADSAAATFQSHGDVFASSKARLLARLSGVEDA